MSGIAIDRINEYLRQWWVYGVTLWTVDRETRLEIRVCDDERITRLPESVLTGYAQIDFHVNSALNYTL